MLRSRSRQSSRTGLRVAALLLAAWFLSTSLAVPLHAQPPDDAPPLAVSFEPTALLLDGVSPMGRAAVLGVGRDRVDYTARTLRFDEVVTADEEGAARFDLPDEQVVPARSVWVAVDLATGAFAVAVPEGTELRRIDAPGRGLGAAASALEQDGRLLDVLLIRPESSPEGAEMSGLWGLRVGDGGETDDDGEANARISLRFAELWPLADSPAAPDRLAPKDVLIGVDPESLEIYAVQLAAPPAEGGQS